MGWYVVFKEGNETLTQIVPDRDEALLVACAVYLQGHLVPQHRDYDSLGMAG